jgi:hypothetical protein
MREDAVRRALADQAVWCERPGSPFTGHLCALPAERLDRGIAAGRAVLDWPGGAVRMLATADAHVRAVRWLA